MGRGLSAQQKLYCTYILAFLTLGFFVGMAVMLLIVSPDQWSGDFYLLCDCFVSGTEWLTYDSNFHYPIVLL
ncbi:MAG: hypothetical protein K0R78_699 [Pelosinus sp.]|jgi:hypothetical protein|nr:hypothetical protein [Pelosinus sp.]